MMLLVCGGRDYNDYPSLEKVLNHFATLESITHIIHGGAKGADAGAGRWARERGIQEVVCPANWLLHGKRAGWLRNQSMGNLVDAGRDIAIAFPGGVGTEMMKTICKQKGISILSPEEVLSMVE